MKPSFNHRILSMAALTLLAADAVSPSQADVISEPLPRSLFVERGKASVQQSPESGDSATGGNREKERREADFLKSRREGVQITELGLMRAAFVFEKGFAAELETRVTEAFSNADFRVFPSGQEVTGRFSPKEAFQMGNDRYADLVVYVKGSQRELKPLQGTTRRLAIYETTVSAQVYNPLSEELLVSTTAILKGDPKADEVEARRASSEAACDAAVRETITKTIEKAHKILVHEAQLKGVQDHQHLLEIMEYTARLKGVYHVRQCSYDKNTKLAVIEIIGAPRTEAFWRAYTEKLPRREVLLKDDGSVRIQKSEQTRAAHRDWFSDKQEKGAK